MILPGMKNFEGNSFTDYSIDQLTFGDLTATDPMAVKWGVGGTQSLKELLVDPTLQPTQKINILQLLFGLNNEQATAMINGSPITV